MTIHQTLSTNENGSPVMVLFGQWLDVYERLNVNAALPEQEMIMLCNLQYEIKQAMFRVTSRDPRDHLAKIVASTTWGDHDLEDDGSADFWAEAKALMLAQS